LFSGELIDAERALRTGLVDEVLPAGELGKRVGEFTRVLAAWSLLTQASAKEFANGRTDRDAYWAEQARGSDDTAEGVAAFLERRPPRFTWTTPASTATSQPSTATPPSPSATTP
jgi:enoyl-CoA hydratase/carnithine racemase